MAVAGKVNVTPVEEKSVDDEPLVYANKQVYLRKFTSLFLSVIVKHDDHFRFHPSCFISNILGGKECVQITSRICKCPLRLELGTGNQFANLVKCEVDIFNVYG